MTPTVNPDCIDADIRSDFHGVEENHKKDLKHKAFRIVLSFWSYECFISWNKMYIDNEKGELITEKIDPINKMRRRSFCFVKDDESIY